MRIKLNVQVLEPLILDIMILICRLWSVVGRREKTQHVPTVTFSQNKSISGANQEGWCPRSKLIISSFHLSFCHFNSCTGCSLFNQLFTVHTPHVVWRCVTPVVPKRSLSAVRRRGGVTSWWICSCPNFTEMFCRRRIHKQCKINKVWTLTMDLHIIALCFYLHFPTSLGNCDRTINTVF